MHYVASNSRLADVLVDVGNAGGLRLDVTSKVRGDVNAVFEQPPIAVFRTLIEAWGLIWYFDGQSIHVSTADDARTRTIGFAPLTNDAIRTLLRKLELDDPHLPLRFSGDSVKVTGPSRYVDTVADAIAKALSQIPAPQPNLEHMEIHVFPLRYAQAQDITYTSGNREQVLAGVASLLRRLMENTAAPRTVTRVGKRSATAQAGPTGVPPLPRLPGLLDTSIDTQSSDDPAQLPQSDVTLARRNIIADTRTNSVVVCDVPEMMPAYERAIAMLDQPQDLVEISAVVMDVSSDAAKEIGIRWGAGASTGRSPSTRFGAPLPVQAGGLNAALAAGPGFTLTTLIGNSAHYLYEQIHALEQSGRAHILSRPRVLTLNNAEAVLSSRNSVYVRVAGNQDASLFNVDTGLTLKVTPTVEKGDGEHSRILLSVQIEDGSFDDSASVDGIPRVNNNSIITQAVVSDGESLLIGGYEYERSQHNGSKVPILGDIPFLGALFSDDQTAVDRSERLVLITPHVKRLTSAAVPSGIASDIARVPNAPSRSASETSSPPLPGASDVNLPQLPVASNRAQAVWQRSAP